jgi:hypothetical protein
MKFELEPYNRDFSKEDLISDIKKVATSLRNDTLTQEEYNKHGKFSSSSCVRRFGGWLNALEKAGLEKSRNYNISEEEWFNNLEHVWTSLGRQPYPSDMEKPLSRYSHAGYKRKFGGWRKALGAFVEYINKEDIPTITSLSSKPEISKKHKTNRNIGLRLRFIVMRNDNFKCRICGGSPATDQSIKLEVDHINPWSQGGETVIENLQTLCFYCNSGKSNLKMKTKNV